MSTSFSDLRMRVLGFLADPKSDPSFPDWFVSELDQLHSANNPELETAMRAIQRAFSEGSEGHYTRESLADAVRHYLAQCEQPQERLEAKRRVYTLPLFVFGSQSASQVVHFSESGSNLVPSFEKISQLGDNEPKRPSGGATVVSVWEMAVGPA